MMYSLALDIILAVLLVATIGYAMVLNRKLGNLRGHKEELERLAATFSESTARAKESIANLKISTADLQANTAKASGMRDDLKFLIDRSSAAADRLETAVRESRGEETSGGSPVSGKPRQPVETLDQSIATADNRNHIDSRNGKPRPADDARDNKFSSETEDSDDNTRSQAEKELIEALRSVR